MYEFVAEDEDYVQEAFLRSLVEIPFVSKHMENFMRALSNDERNRPQYARLMQAYGDLQQPGKNKRKSAGSQNSSECHTVLGTTPQSTQEDLKKALKIQMLRLSDPAQQRDYLFPCHLRCDLCVPRASPPDDIFRWQCVRAARDTLADANARCVYRSLIQADPLPRYQWRTTGRIVYQTECPNMDYDEFDER